MMTTTQNKSDVGSLNVGAIERFIDHVRANHPEIPRIGVTISTAPIRNWGRVLMPEDQKSADNMPVWIDKRTGEKCPVIAVEDAILHEPGEVVANHAVRSLAVAECRRRGLKPFTKNGDRLYTRNFRDLATEFGLKVEKIEGSVDGWAYTTVPLEFRTQYADAIAELEMGLVAHRATDEDVTPAAGGNADTAAGRSAELVADSGNQADDASEQPTIQQADGAGGSPDPGSKPAVGTTTDENGGVMPKPPRDTKKGDARKRSNTKPKPPNDGGKPRNGDDNVKLELHCGCDPARRFEATVEWVETDPGTHCDGCDENYRVSPRQEQKMFQSAVDRQGAATVANPPRPAVA